MRLDGDEDVEIAGRPAVDAGLTFARQADACSFFDARRNVDAERSLLLHMAAAFAALAGVLDDASIAFAARTGAFDREETLLCTHFADARTGGTLLRLVTGFRAAAATRLAGDSGWHLDLNVAALEGFLERDFEIVAQVAAAILSPRAPAAHEFAEQIIEHVRKGRGEIEAARAASAHAVFERSVAEAVVSGAFLIVLQDVIGLVDLLEFDFGGVVVGIAIRMKLHRELAIIGFERGSGRALLASEHVVVTALHGRTTEYGRQGSEWLYMLVTGNPIPVSRRPFSGLRRALLLVVVDFGELGVHDIVVRLGRVPRAVGRSIRLGRAFLLRLVHRLAELHRSLRQRLGLGLDALDVVGLDRFLQRGDGIFDVGPFCRVDVAAMLAQRLLRRMDQRIALVLGFDQRAAFLVLRRMAFGFLHHLLDVGFRKSAGCLNANLLLLVGRLVLRGDRDNAVRVDVEGDLDLWNSTRCRRDAHEVELAEHLVVGCHFALALEDADRDGRLIVLSRRKNLRLLGRDRRVAVDTARENA